MRHIQRKQNIFGEKSLQMIPDMFPCAILRYGGLAQLVRALA